MSNPSMSFAATASVRGPRIRPLDRRQIEFVLARNRVGRVAFIADGCVEIHPVHYVYDDGALYGRTALGIKHLAWLVKHDVAFEVDEIDGLFDWRSIVVRGTVSILRARGQHDDRLAFRNAVAAIRKLVPDAFTERDPTPDRRVIFRIQLQLATGREARSVEVTHQASHHARS